MHQISSTTVKVHSEVLRDDSTIVEEVELKVTEKIDSVMKPQTKKEKPKRIPNNKPKQNNKSKKHPSYNREWSPLSNQTYKGIQVSQPSL